MHKPHSMTALTVRMLRYVPESAQSKQSSSELGFTDESGGEITPSKSVNLRYRDNKTQHPHLHLGCVSPAMFNFFSGSYIPSAQNWISPM